MSNILIEEFSPACNIQAFVEEYDNCVYFYLWNFSGQSHSSIRSCWIRNYLKAPDTLQVEEMRNSCSPMLQKDCCSHPEGAEKLDPEELSIVMYYLSELMIVNYFGRAGIRILGHQFSKTSLSQSQQV